MYRQKIPHGQFPLYVVQVLDYYDKFKKTGDPLKTPIDQTEFLEIMQVKNKTWSCFKDNLQKMSKLKGGTDAFTVVHLIRLVWEFALNEYKV